MSSKRLGEEVCLNRQVRGQGPPKVAARDASKALFDNTDNDRSTRIERHSPAQASEWLFQPLQHR